MPPIVVYLNASLDMYTHMLLDVCECVPNSEDLEQSSTVNICIGTSVNPCICNDTSCMVSSMYVVKCGYASCHTYVTTV